MREIFLVAGEASGDLHGSALMDALKKADPLLRFSGVLGPKMRCQGGETVLKMEELQLIGFWDVLLSLPSILQKFSAVRQSILERDPDLVILIDYPGFNLRLAKSLRKAGFRGKIVQYICPTLWAWRPSRKAVLEKYYDALFVLLPFEKSCFTGSPLQVEFVGHPLRDAGKSTFPNTHCRTSLSIPEKAPLFAFFPGSRPSEIALNLPTMLKVIDNIVEEDPSAYFALSCSSPKIQSLINPYLSNLACKERCRLFPSQLNYPLMKEASSALAKSGTVVLELALFMTPTVVIYKVKWMEKALLRYIFKLSLPFFSLPNILLQKEVFPEYIRKEGSPKEIAGRLIAFATDKKKRASLESELAKLPELLSPAPQSPSMASSLLQLLIKP